jgi:hypothetical protein
MVNAGDHPAELSDEPIFRGEHVVLLTARLPVELADALFREASARGTSPSELIVRSLRTLLGEADAP